ncbi:MAG: tetratricopeptide repeat protein [Magnetospirillum sp. WYHS-4]
MADSKIPSKPVINPEQDALLIEIDEDLRHEQYTKLWKKYGNAVIGAALLLVVGVAGYQGWRHFDTQARLEQGRSFATAQDLMRKGQADAARLAFADFAAKARPGYAVLAHLQEAALLARAGNASGAAAAYRKVASDGAIDAPYRDLATLLGVLQEMESAPAADLTARLAPLTADASPWRYSARELTAVLALASGDKAKARGLLEALGKDTRVPSGIGQRAADLLVTLGQS